MTRRLVALAALLLAGGAVLWSLLVPPRDVPIERRVMEVAASLRCPTCGAESAADSAAPTAQAMRGIIRERLAAGQEPAQVRAHFAERYGRWVLLEPPMSGADRLLWVAPLAAAGVAGLLVVRVVGRASRPEPEVERQRVPRVPTRRGAAAALASVALVAVAATAAAGGAARPTPTAAPAARSGSVPAPAPDRDAPPPDVEAQVEAHRAAVRERPGDPAATFRLGFALVKAERHAEAEPVLADLVAQQPAHREALLLLGTTQRALDRQGWRATLERFLALAPDHAAAPVVRRLLAGRP